MFLVFLSVAVAGTVLLLTVIALYSGKDAAEDTTHVAGDQQGAGIAEHPETAGRPAAPEQQHEPRSQIVEPSQTERPVEREAGSGAPAAGGTGTEGFVPVLHPPERVPDLKGNERVHFIAPAVLYSVDSTAPLEEIELGGQLKEELRGELVLTSGRFLVFRDGEVKRFNYALIEHFLFREGYFIMKRKNVKKKKDIMEIRENPVEFEYILRTLL